MKPYLSLFTCLIIGCIFLSGRSENLSIASEKKADNPSSCGRILPSFKQGSFSSRDFMKFLVHVTVECEHSEEKMVLIKKLLFHGQLRKYCGESDQKKPAYLQDYDTYLKLLLDTLARKNSKEYNDLLFKYFYREMDVSRMSTEEKLKVVMRKYNNYDKDKAFYLKVLREDKGVVKIAYSTESPNFAIGVTHYLLKKIKMNNVEVFFPIGE